MSHRIKKVEYVDGYRLKLYFDDQSIKIVDFEERLKTAKNMLIPLRDIDYFKKVKCDGYSIIWPNEVDFCPDALYDMGKDIVRTEKKTRRVSGAIQRRKKTTVKPQKARTKK